MKQRQFTANACVECGEWIKRTSIRCRPCYLVHISTREVPQSNPNCFCKCGCGQKTYPYTATHKSRGAIKGHCADYVRGHYKRKAKEVPPPPQKAPRHIVDTGRSGFCECGCGGKTSVPKWSDAKRGVIGGVPNRFIRGHQGRTHKHGYMIDPITGCWNWNGAVSNNGYAQTVRHRKKVGAHRVAFMERFGEIPPRFHVHHQCENRKCVNPEHMEAISPSDHAKLTNERTRERRAA